MIIMHAIGITCKLKCYQDNAKQYTNDTAICVTQYRRRWLQIKRCDEEEGLHEN
jgi:hypothetical protein